MVFFSFGLSKQAFMHRVMLSQLNIFINAKKKTSWLPLYHGPQSSLSAKHYRPQSKIHSGKTLNCVYFPQKL